MRGQIHSLMLDSKVEELGSGHLSQCRSSWFSPDIGVIHTRFQASKCLKRTCNTMRRYHHHQLLLMPWKWPWLCSEVVKFLTQIHHSFFKVNRIWIQKSCSLGNIERLVLVESWKCQEFLAALWCFNQLLHCSVLSN